MSVAEKTSSFTERQVKWSNWSGHPDKPHNGGSGGVHDQEDSTSVFR